MAMKRDLHAARGPSGALVVWLGGLVIGIGVAIVLVYHFMLASHNGIATGELARVKRPSTALQVSVDASDDMRKAQAALLKGKPEAGPAASDAPAAATPPSGPKPSPAQ